MPVRDLGEQHDGRGALREPSGAFVRIGGFGAEVCPLLVRLDSNAVMSMVRSLSLVRQRESAPDSTQKSGTVLGRLAEDRLPVRGDAKRGLVAGGEGPLANLIRRC